MSSHKFMSQAEAYRLKRRVRELELNERVRFNRYRSSYPGGVHAVDIVMEETSLASLNMADKLGCAIVAKIRGQHLDIYAVPKEINHE